MSRTSGQGGAFFGSRELHRVLHEVEISYFDLGARGTLKNDLAPLAPVVDIVAFEPDPAAPRPWGGGGWRSVRSLEVGLSGRPGSRTLHVSGHGGTSSLLRGLPDVGARFGRAEYYDLVEELEVNTTTLDAAISEYDLPLPTFLKLDIEGLELEVMEASPRAVDSAVGLRIEVAFERVFKGQPLFHDVNRFLVDRGFTAMHFVEMHHWRRSTRAKYPSLANHGIPYSRGQLIHGDVLYLRSPENLAMTETFGVFDALACAYIAMCFEQLDHARACFRLPRVRQYLAERFGLLDVDPELSTVSKRLLAEVRRREARRARRVVVNQLRHYLRQRF